MRNPWHNGGILGLLSGLLWGLNSVVIGLVLVSPSISSLGVEGTLIATWIHEAVSLLILMSIMLFLGNMRRFRLTLFSKTGAIIIFAALMGGPLGMGSYILSIQYLGASLAASGSAIYPAFGAFLAYLVFRDKMKLHSTIGLMVAVIAISLMGYSSDIQISNLYLGLFFLILSVIGWGSEAVIINAALKESVSSDIASAIRQLTSMIVYGLILMFTVNLSSVRLFTESASVITLMVIAAVSGTFSYLAYYKAIDLIGPTQAMGLNISYPAWAFLFQFIFTGYFNLTTFILVIFVMIGSILSNDKPSDLLPKRFKRQMMNKDN